MKETLDGSKPADYRKRREQARAEAAAADNGARDIAMKQIREAKKKAQAAATRGQRSGTAGSRTRRASETSK